MSFSDLVADMHEDVFEVLGEPATFTRLDSSVVQTRVILDESTAVVGDLGQLADHRPTIALPKADVGRPRGGTVVVLGRTFQLDRLVDRGANPHESGGDGYRVRYYVREIT